MTQKDAKKEGRTHKDRKINKAIGKKRMSHNGKWPVIV